MTYEYFEYVSADRGLGGTWNISWQILTNNALVNSVPGDLVLFHFFKSDENAIVETTKKKTV